jgi:tetratricopeptide (TPR) repeat protein
MWTARPVFISSTFVDMQAERDHLRNFVFTKLEEDLRKRRHFLEWVDLRVGVATASEDDAHARELYVLKVCLDEVRRCRPFLIVLLGDRYGWVPPKDRSEAAAKEAGFSTNVDGRSVTDLEIDFGVLSDTAQQRRSFFYFREPLPYRDMPGETAARYSDSYDPKLSAAEQADRVIRLAALKRRIERQLPNRVHRYSLQWDADDECITGLKDWGGMVLKHIWDELDAETKAYEAAADIRWQRAEREALEDFAADRARDFVGRQEIIDSLTSLCLSPVADGAIWGACVTGDPGSGKSALFGELCRRPEPETENIAPEDQRCFSGLTRRLGGKDGGDVFPLAHAAGASIAAPSVDSMLRRWIDELASALKIPDVGLAENADPDTVEAAFTRLLHQMAAERRVVVLVDALDQFENTTRGRFATWLPRLWPPNARFFATTIAGEASKELAKRPGMQTLSLPALDPDEARDIFKGICDRYHRTFEPEVIDKLLAKTGPAGPAWGNPLWLVIAVEELNLLDADDFDRARTYEGLRPDEQLRELMLEDIDRFPGDIPGLYEHTFKRAEKLFGESLTRAFLGLIAVSRAGWRESDFRILLPRASGENWDELKFAQLRRLFRGQLRRRGALAQWDFSHAQMRAAVGAQLLAWSTPETNLHAIVADRLLSCPPDDPLHITETMVHLLASEDYDRAAGYYGNSSLSEAEVEGATRALADAVIAPRSGTPATAAQDVCRLLDTPHTFVRAQVGERFLFNLSAAIQQNAPLDPRLTVCNSTREAFEQLLRSTPDNPHWLRGLAAAYERVANIQVAQGKLQKALKSINDEGAIREQLAPYQDIPLFQRDLSVYYERVGDVQVAEGNLTGALKSYRDGLAISEGLAKSDPGNIGWLRDLSVSLIKVGDVLMAQGNIAGALKSYRDSLAIRDRLAKSDPANAGWQRDLSASLIKVGDVQEAQGDLAGALELYGDSLAIADRLAQSNPGNAVWQRDLSVAYIKIGNVQAARGHLPEAVKSRRNANAILDRLAKSDPSNAGWQRDLAVSYDYIGDVQAAQGHLPEAVKSRRNANAILDRLAKSDPSNMGWQSDLSRSYERVGDVQRAQGDLAGALKDYRDSLAIRDRLAKSDPGNAGWQRDLFSALWCVSDIEIRQGDLSSALEKLKAGQTIMDRLAQSDPGNAGWQRDVSVSLSKVGDVQVGQGDFAGALKSYRDSLAIFDRLAKSDASKAGWQRDVSVSYGKVGSVQVAQGELADALNSYRDSIAIIDRLAQSDPSNAGWQRHLSVVYEKVGDVQVAQGDLAGALKSFRDSLAIADRLAKSDPGNAEWQFDLGISHDRIGDVQMAQGDLAGASKSYEARRDIISRLAKSDPGNASWQRDLIVACVKLAKSDQSQARTLLTRASEVAQQMQQRGQLTPQDAWMPADLTRRIAALAQSGSGDAGRQRDRASSLEKAGDVQKAQGDLPGALTSYRDSFAIFERLAKSDPDNADWERHLSLLLNKIGDVQRAQGDRLGALKSYRDSLAIGDRLARGGGAR